MRTLSTGFSLIEVLVSVVILSIGLLGVAALQLAGLQYGQGAYQQSQATAAVADLVDRMRANPDPETAFDQYTFDSDDDGVPSEDCGDSNCGPSQIARHDVREWRTDMLSRLSGASAEVTRNDNEFTITVRWLDTAEHADEDADGEDDDAVTRTMTTTVDLPRDGA